MGCDRIMEYISYIFWGNSYEVPVLEKEDCNYYPNDTKMIVIDGEIRIIINDKPPNAKIPTNKSRFWEEIE